MNKKITFLTLIVTILLVTTVIALSGSGSSGQVTFWSNSSDLAGNNNLYWDNNNSRLGIGTTDPSEGSTVTSKFTIRQTEASTGLAIYSSTGARRLAINPESTGELLHSKCS